jgi:hypothetical protein
MQLSYRPIWQQCLTKITQVRQYKVSPYDLYSSAMPNERAVRIIPTRKMV